MGNIFDRHPTLKSVFVTSDGTPFFNQNTAELHAKTLEDKTVKEEKNPSPRKEGLPTNSIVGREAQKAAQAKEAEAKAAEEKKAAEAKAEAEAKAAEEKAAKEKAEAEAKAAEEKKAAEAKAEKHIVTEEDLEANPDLSAQGVKEGDEIEIPAEAETKSKSSKKGSSKQGK